MESSDDEVAIQFRDTPQVEKEENMCTMVLRFVLGVTAVGLLGAIAGGIWWMKWYTQKLEYNS